MPSCFDRVVVMRSRSYVFVVVIIMGILWIGVLSADAYSKGRYRTVSESVSITLLLAFHVLSSSCIPIFALLDVSDSIERSRWYSHVWFELAWLSILLVFHSAAALVFSVLSPSFDCQNSNVDSVGGCQLVNVYISIASWMTPAILFYFISYFVLVCLRTAKRFPTLWHTPVRLCPWDGVDGSLSKTASDVQPSSSVVEPRNIEEGSRRSVSQLSSPHVSSRGSSQTLAPLATPIDPPPRRTSHYSRPLPHPLARPVISRPPPPQIHPYLSPSRMVSQLPPLRIGFRPPSSRMMSQLPPARTPSCPIPLRRAVMLHPPQSDMSLSPNDPFTPPTERDPTNNSKRASELERYCDSWNRNRRGSALHPTWLA